MGTNVAPSYANLVLAIVEQRIWKKYPELETSYQRFLDDGFLIWPYQLELIDEFKLFMNKLCPGLNFTWQQDETIPFLDLNLRIDRNHSRRAMHISLHCFTSPHGDYPQRYQESWITGENIRLLRNHSDKRQFESAISQFKHYLRLSGYTEQIIQNHIIHKYEKRPYYLNLVTVKSKQLDLPDVIVQPFTPGWTKVQEITRVLINKTEQLVRDDNNPSLKSGQVTTIALARGVNICNSLNSINKKVLAMNSTRSSSPTGSLTTGRPSP